ncbi:MAG: hypothetical protein GY703_00125 [Gammaproteobacteria bacterium]|nr:hypothetical protein [Gammaproteobacteria bacterium]
MARYLSIAIPFLGPTLSQPEYGRLLDPFDDTDDDGLDNRQELQVWPSVRTDPSNPNSDRDLYTDAYDPCPDDPHDLCLAHRAQMLDSDGSIGWLPAILLILE